MVWLPVESLTLHASRVYSTEPAPQSNDNMTQDSCAHRLIRVSELVAKTSRLNPTRVSRMFALVCDDCGRVLFTDSIQPINQILKALESLEERISAIERASEADRDSQYRVAA
jgi:hypothetical protein